MNLQASHFHAPTCRHCLQLVVDANAARDEGAGDHRPESAHREDAVDRQAQRPHPLGRVRAAPARSRSASRSRSSPAPERDDTGMTGADASADPSTSSAMSARTTSQHLVVREIALRDDDDAARNAEQPADVEVLARLRHDRFVGGDHQQHGVDAADAGQHVPHEALVSRNVDEGDRRIAVAQIGEAEIDRDAARLFFFQPIGIGAGQRAGRARSSRDRCGRRCRRR